MRTADNEAMNHVFLLFNGFNRTGMCKFILNLIQDSRKGGVQKVALLVSMNTLEF